MATLSMAWGGCGDSVINADLHGSIEQATTAYGEFDEATFLEGLGAIESDLPCLSEVIAPSYAAALHRMRGIRAFLEKDYGVSELHFAAARTIEPDYRFPEVIAPAGNPIHARYDAIDLSSTPALEALSAPRRGTYRLDGQLAEAHDTRIPVLLQRIAPSGAVVGSEFIDPGIPMPLPGERIREPKPVPILFIAGVGSLTAAAGCMAGAWLSKDSFRDATDTKQPADIQRAYDRNLRWNAAAGVLGVAGAGLVTAHFVFP